MLKGELNREDCDEEKVYEFLRLLKRPKRLIPDDNDCMQNAEWRIVVKTQKRAALLLSFQEEIVRCLNVP